MAKVHSEHSDWNITCGSELTILRIPLEDLKKYAMLSAFTGKAADMVRCLGPEQPLFRGLNFA